MVAEIIGLVAGIVYIVVMLVGIFAVRRGGYDNYTLALKAYGIGWALSLIALTARTYAHSSGLGWSVIAVVVTVFTFATTYKQRDRFPKPVTETEQTVIDNAEIIAELEASVRKTYPLLDDLHTEKSYKYPL